MLLIKSFSICISACVLLFAPALTMAKPFKIGFISTADADASRMKVLIEKELAVLSKQPREIEYASLIAEANQQSFSEQMRIANKDNSINAIVFPGILGSQYIYQKEAFIKPTFLSWVFDPSLTGAQIKSNTANLYWFSMSNEVERTFKTVNQVIGNKPVTLVLDKSLSYLGEGFSNRLIDEAKSAGLSLSIVFLNPVTPVSEQIAADTALVFVPPLGLKTLSIIEEIQSKNMPVFSFEGPKAVAAGVMMTDVVNANNTLVARNIALDLLALYRQETLPVGPRWLDSESHITLNLGTAKRIGVNLPVSILSSATVVGFENNGIKGITLDQALNWALSKNPIIAQSRSNLEIANQSTIQAKSSLLPQLNASVSHTQYDNSGNTVAMVGNPDQNTQASLNVSQVLYSVSSSSDYKVAKINEEGKHYIDAISTQNIIVNTLNTFLQVLIAEANLHAQEENVQLARANLSMAQKREKLGSGAIVDVYNSESAIATADSNLLSARIKVLESKRALMTITNTKFDENTVIDKVDLNHLPFANFHRVLEPLLKELNGIENLANWSAQQAVNESPDLQALTLEITSNEEQLKAAKKNRYSPEVTLNGQAYRYLDSSTGSSGADFNDTNDASISLNVTVPLWTSGRNSSLAKQASEGFINAELEYISQKNKAQVNARNAVYSLAQAWQDVKLGELALSSAKKTLDINQQSYSKGAITIEELQAIQNTYISALSANNTNIYEYIIALVKWQREVAAVGHIVDLFAVEQWIANFQSQFSQFQVK